MPSEDETMDSEIIIAKAVADLAPEVREFAESVGLLGPAREIIGGWTDRLQIRREERRLRALTAAASRVRPLGVPISAVKDRFLAEILDGAADEDDPELHGLWSNLLANAAIGTDMAPSFPTVLRQIEPVEAHLLDAALRYLQRRLPGVEVPLDELPAFDALRWRHLDNMERLGLISFSTAASFVERRPERPVSVFMYVNPYGEAFVTACSDPASPSA
jgi:hypothetical protein